MRLTGSTRTYTYATSSSGKRKDYTASSHSSHSSPSVRHISDKWVSSPFPSHSSALPTCLPRVKQLPPFLHSRHLFLTHSLTLTTCRAPNDGGSQLPFIHLAPFGDTSHPRSCYSPTSRWKDTSYLVQTILFEPNKVPQEGKKMKPGNKKRFEKDIEEQE